MRRNSIDKAERIARRYLSPKRLNHSLGVRDMALDLAQRWGGDKELLEKAALVHDLGYSLGGRALDHAIIAGRLLEPAFDKELRDMVLYHTLGHRIMSLEEKILFLADGIESGRRYPGVRRIRSMAFKDLDRALNLYINSTEEYLRASGQELHRNTRQLRKEIRRDNGRISKRNHRIFRRKTGRRSLKL